MTNKLDIKFIEAVRKDPESFNDDDEFINWVIKNKSKLSKVLSNCSLSIPTYFYFKDNLFNIGKIYSYAICKAFPRIFSPVENKPYDVLFKKRLRISLKSRRTAWGFQKDDTAKVPKIKLKTCQSKSMSLNGKEWDAMLLVQGQNVEKGIPFRFGAATFEAATLNDKYNNTGSINNTNLYIQIANDNYNFLSGALDFCPEKDDNNLNSIFVDFEKQLYQSLLDS